MLSSGTWKTCTHCMTGQLSYVKHHRRPWHHTCDFFEVWSQGGEVHCIAAGYAREHEVPAVVGVGGVMEDMHTSDVIRIDGSGGTVEIVG